MKKILWVFLVIVAISCAKVNLQTAQPLKVDINMRVDVYQHVAADVASVQDQIYGSTQKQINFLNFTQEAYAQTQSPEVTAAIERRKDRRNTIEDYFSKGFIGETSNAYLEAIAKDIPENLKSTIANTISEENNDRRIIYKSIAAKNGVDIAQTEKIFFDDDYKRAPAGYWFQSSNGSWKQK